MKLNRLKTYIKTDFINNFIQLSQSSINILIFYIIKIKIAFKYKSNTKILII